MIYRITVGVGRDADGEPVRFVEEKLQTVKPYLARVFGGFTLYRATGGWMNGGEYVEELSLVFELAPQFLGWEEDMVKQASELLRVMFRQKCVVVMSSDDVVRFNTGGHYGA